MKRSIVHPGRLLKRALAAREPSVNRLSLELSLDIGVCRPAVSPTSSTRGVRSLRIRRCGLGAISAAAQFWLDLQSQYDIAVVEQEKGGEIAKRAAGGCGVTKQGALPRG